MNRVATPRDTETIEVDVLTVDSLVANVGLRPMVLKIDVEGYEIPLRGATALLKEVVAIIIELNGGGSIYQHTDREVHDLLIQAGFQCFDYESGTRELCHRQNYRRDHMNTLYIRSDALPMVRARIASASGHDLQQQGARESLAVAQLA